MPSGARCEDMSFAQALDQLYATNESLIAATLAVDEKKYEKDAARGLYFPKIQASGSITRIDEPVIIDLNDIRSAMLALHPAVPAQLLPSFEMQVQGDTSRQATLSAQWTLFSGGQILAVNRAADALVTDAREKKRTTESMLTTELVRRYFGMQLARRMTAMRQETLDSLERHLTRVRRLEAEGMVAHVETLHAQVARAEAERELMGARRDEDLAHTALQNLLACSTDIGTVTPLFIVRTLDPLDHFRSLSLERNPLLKQITARREAAHQAYKKEVGTLFPQVALFGQKEMLTDDLTIFDPEWACGVGVNFTLFEGGTRANRIRAARATEERGSRLEDQARRDMTTLVEKRYQEFAKAVEQFDALGTAISSAEEYLRVRQRSFEENCATSLDVVDARLSLTKVMTGRILAAYQTDCALAELLEASGISEQFESYRKRAEGEVQF